MKHVSAILALGLAAFMAFGEVIYENDFSTRTSAGAIPYGGWREVPYVVGKLVNNSPVENENPFQGGTSTDFQDNWIKAQPAFASVVNTDGNPEAVCYAQSGKAQNIVAMHRLGNTFTSGIVRVQCDMKTPATWLSNGSRSIRLLVGDSNFFSPWTDGSIFLQYLAGGAGLSMTASGAYRFFLYGYVTADLNNGAYATDPLPQGGKWYRAVITANLDTMKYDAALYNMGAAHPMLDAETPAAAEWSVNGTDFWCVTKGQASAFKGISAVGIAAYSAGGTLEQSDNHARFDNLRVWHDGVECYVNDFASRRARNLSEGTMTATYHAPTALATNAYPYVEGTTLTAPLNTSIDRQPIQFDGWRRLNKLEQSTLIPYVTPYTNNMALRFVGRANGIAVQPLGQTLTGGKVRMTADIRITSFYTEQTTSYTDILLGGDLLYTGSNNGNAYNDGQFARVGVTAGQNGTDANGNPKRVPRWASSDDGQGTNRKMYYADSGAATENKWFRMEILADLEARTYDFTIYEMCAATNSPAINDAAGAVLFSKTGVKCYQPQTSISTIGISQYQGGSYFDNLRVWHKPAGASAERLVYSNSFSMRTLYGIDSVEESLVGRLERDPVGIDGWTRQFKGGEGFALVGGENPALGPGSVGERSNFIVHDLGGLYDRGKVTVQFDARVPGRWGKADGGLVWVWLGGDRYHEGNLYGGSSGSEYFANWVACGAGLSITGGAWTNSTFVTFSGDGAGGGSQVTIGTAAPGHWYRFVMNSNLAASMSDIEVFEMGTAQPTLATATPTGGAVATFASVPFRRANAALGGVSCIGVQAKQVTAGSPLDPTDYRLLIDNIRVSYAPNGLMIMFR